MSSNFTQAQRDFLNNVKQSIALIDRGSFNVSESKESLFVRQVSRLIGKLYL
jgi:hypothetical protein